MKTEAARLPNYLELIHLAGRQPLLRGALFVQGNGLCIRFGSASRSRVVSEPLQVGGLPGDVAGEAQGGRGYGCRHAVEVEVQVGGPGRPGGRQLGTVDSARTASCRRRTPVASVRAVMASTRRSGNRSGVRA